MRTTVANRLLYYRNTVADTGRMNPDIATLRKENLLLLLSREEAMSGVPEDAEAAKAFLERSLKTPREGASGGDDDGRVAGVLCPWIYTPRVVHGAAAEGAPFALLCVPAILSSEGRLLPSGEPPWIPRTVLQPLNSEGPTVGSVEDSDRFLASLESGSVETWEELAATCSRYIAAVTGSETPPEIEGYLIDGRAAFFAADTIKATLHLAKLYDALLADKGSFPLLERMIEGANTSEPLLSPEEEIEVSRGHVGCMSPKFPLSPSQRKALHHFMRTGRGEVLALNGPPGTGKTTMLQSVVAQLWVDAALRKTECPLIVASSTNNQAVTNIIDSFGKVARDENDPLYERWLPGITGFGLQMAREERWKEGFHAYDNPFRNGKPETSGLFEKIERPEWLEEAEALFLEKASERYGPLTNVASASERLHAELWECAESVGSLLDALLRTAPSSPDAKIGEETRRRLGELEESLESAAKELENGRRLLARAEETRILWEKHLASESFLVALLSFLPPVRKRKEAADRAFLLERSIACESADREKIREALARQREEAAKGASEAEARLNERTRALSSLEESWSKAASLASLARINLDAEDVSLNEATERLDTSVRAKAFRVASHYWEAEYLRELRGNIESKYRDSAAPDKRARMYRRFAKLVPCQIATFFMLPNYYCGYRGKPIHMYGEIDLLIVDEAGQVAPEIGVPSFSLAKRALVVGDIFQIEPVWSVAVGTDSANAVESGVVRSEEEYEELEKRGFFAASGNLMRMAQLACRHTQYPELSPGMMLVEHRRCVPEIIAYCNDLVYKGKLEPRRRESEEERRSRPSFLPAMGEIPTVSDDERASGSRRNPEEAARIAEWTKEHLKELETRYEKPIGEILGIVTPFAAQKKAVRKALADALGDDRGVVTGTVHALQGAERDVVLFSPVYGRGHSGNTFFDAGPNMMNVAVSRARDSFIVVGNPDLFVEGSGKPSGILARHLRKPSL